MKKDLFYLLLGVTLVGLMASGRASAQPASEEGQLEAEGKAIDQDSAGGSNEARVDALASQYQVPASTVQDLRNDGRGWGEVSIELAMADHLAKSDPSTYPTQADALQKIDSMREDGKGWGAISKELGFKLGPVVSESHRMRGELKSAGTVESPKVPKAEKASRSQREEHLRPSAVPQKPAHPGRPERFDRPERPSRPERPQHSSR